MQILAVLSKLASYHAYSAKLAFKKKKKKEKFPSPVPPKSL